MYVCVLDKKKMFVQVFVMIRKPRLLSPSQTRFSQYNENA